MELSRVIDRYKIPIVLSIFIGFLVIGLSIYDNYGVHWDEYHNQIFGRKWIDYIKKTIQEGYPPKIEADLDSQYNDLVIISDSYPLTVRVGEHDVVHGPVFEFFLVVNEKLLNLSDSRDIILMRHLSTFFLFFLSVLIFYFLCQNVFKSWEIGLLGSLFLVIHPRLFSHSFYNSVDIPFLAFYIISTYTLIRFLDNKTYASAFLHALTCAILIDIRIAGLILLFCTFLFFAIEIFISENRINLIKKIIVFIAILLFLVFLFWPYLWNDPLGNFYLALTSSTGTFFNRPVPPWFYNFLWIFDTTPLLYTLFFLIGLFSSFRCFLKGPVEYFNNNKGILIAFSLFLFPIILPILFRTALFDGWRHHYFVYPMFIFIGLIGVKYTFYFSRQYFYGKPLQIINSFICFFIVLSLICTSNFIIKNHPHENTYLNFLGGKNIGGRNKWVAKVNSSLDYWGLSYRKLLEYILANNDGIIKVYATNEPAWNNSRVLRSKDRERLEYVDEENAEILLTNYRYYKVPSYYEEYYALRVNGVKIAGAYKIRDNKRIGK